MTSEMLGTLGTLGRSETSVTQQQHQTTHNDVQHQHRKSRPLLIMAAPPLQPQLLAVVLQGHRGAGQQLRPLLEVLLVSQEGRELLEGDEGLGLLLQAAQLLPWKHTTQR